MDGINLDFLKFSELSTLQELSTVAVASQLWSLEEMKMVMEEVLDRHYPRNPDAHLMMIKSCLEALSVKISDTVSHIFHQAKISLPQVLKTKIENKALERVEEVNNWMLYLIKGLKLDYKAAKRIYWTTDGRIDEDKIFRLFWVDKLVGEPVKWKKFDLNLNLLQCLACFFGQEEFISLHQSDYIRAAEPLKIENHDIVLTIIRSVIVYYNNLYFVYSYSNNNLGRVKFRIINMSTVEMLSFCKRFCFHKPFLYFWNRLDATERFNFLETQSKTRSLYRNEATIYGTEQNLKIILFLMEQMEESQRYNFILNNFSDVILIFSRNKNCKKFCMPLVELYLPTINEPEKYNFLMNCANICNRSNQFDIELEIIKCLVENEPRHKIIEPNLNLTKHNPFQVIKLFFENFNIPALKFIIKDESSESRKKDLIGIGKMKFRELIANNNFKLLDSFMNEVLSSEAEKDKFKQDYNFLEEWIGQCRFDVVDNVLIWMYGAASLDIKISLKNLFCSSIGRDYEAIEKLLRWFFDAPGPLINNCQSKLEHLNEFCSGLIYNLWFPKYYTLENRFTASDISTKILIFSFSSEGEIQNFKTNVLANEERCINFFCEKGWNNWECNLLLSVLDDFLNFCNLPKNKEDYIKSSLNKKRSELALMSQN